MALGVGGTWRATGGRLGGKGTTFAYILPRTPLLFPYPRFRYRGPEFGLGTPSPTRVPHAQTHAQTNTRTSEHGDDSTHDRTHARTGSPVASSRRKSRRDSSTVKIVNLTSFKGGAGKTTAAMLLCSVLTRNGLRVAVADADENLPLLAWREASRAAGHWDERCTIERADDMAGLERAYDAAATTGIDVLVIDTRGGGSELNNTCVLNASEVIVPTALTGLDMTAALETFEYAVRLVHDHGKATPVRMLLQRVPIGRLSQSQERDLALLSSLPRFGTELHQRDAFGSLSRRGMLHLVLKSIADAPRTRIAATHLWAALAEAEAFADEVFARPEGN